MEETARKNLQKLQKEYSLSSEMEDKLWRYCALVLKWNRSTNLTGAKNASVLIEEHVADALPLFQIVPKNARVLDVGSGAGFPAIILSIVRNDLQVFLVEKNYKKVVFLQTVLREIPIKNASVSKGDIFRQDSSSLHSFDAVMARAVFAPEKWLTIGEPFVSPSGELYAFLANSAPPTPTKLLSQMSLFPYTLPSGVKRTLARYQRKPGDDIS